MTASVVIIQWEQGHYIQGKSGEIIEKRVTHGISDGVSGLEPGGGRLMKVGGCVCAMAMMGCIY